MRFSTISAVLALAASACAQTANFDAITSPTQDQTVAAGSTLDIVWEPSADHTGTVTITLLQGATPATLSLGDVVKAGIDSSVGTYSWTIPSDIGSFATYGFKLTLDSNATVFQYSFPFHITGASTSYSASGTGSSTTPLSTVTKTLSTGTAYTPSSTYTSSANITSIIKTASANSSTLSTVTAVKPTGNSTLSYVASTATVTTASGSTASKTAATITGTGPATATTNAAVANIASGSMALFGGLVLAFAL